MKKYMITAAVAALQMVAVAQTVNVHFKNGQTIQYPSSNVDYVDFSEKAADPTVSAGQVVDLGLSVYWASCNVGAESPETVGERYAWGETKTKSSFTQDNYSYYDNEKAQYIDIGSDIGGTEFDAATVNLGNDWRMPTKNEMQELIDNCTWEWTQINGTNGFKITGKNNNSIFIPAFKMYSFSTQSINVWTSTGKTSNAYRLFESSNKPYVSSIDAGWIGCTIRPVTTNPNAGGTPVDHSQDYKVTDKVTASFTGGSYSSINGRIQGGSKLNVKFSNGSSESVTLTKIQLNDGANGTEGNNLLDTEVEVAAGESKSYTVTVGYAGITTPVIRFTYRYNKKNYTAEATWNF